MRKLTFCLLMALFVSYLTPTSVVAQTETGQIVGTVTDASGGVVPQAKVKVTNVGTAAERNTETDDRGTFTVSNLLPAVYLVRVEKSGFAKTERRVQVTAGAKVGVEITIAVGQAIQVVEVTAEGGVAINITTQTISTVVNSRDVELLPLLTRDPYELISTVGNASKSADVGLTPRGGGFNVNGLRSSSNNILLDGASNNDEFVADVGQAIPLDAMQEFTVLTNSYTAEYGRVGGAVVNAVTKSGTNDLHGTAYWFGRYSALAANTYDNNALGIKKPVFVRNQFGYSVGGPVKKDKLFFFQSTEWIRVRSSSPVNVWIPSPQLLADPSVSANTKGFFSSASLRPGTIDLGSFSRNQLIAQGFDPCAGSSGTGPCKAFNPNTPMFNKRSFSVPSDSGGSLPQDTVELVFRMDWNITNNTQLYGRYAFRKRNFAKGSNVNNIYDGFDTTSADFDNNALVSLVHTFSPRFVSQSKLVFNRLNNFQPLGAAPVGPTLYMFSNTPAKILGNLVAFPGYTPFSPGNAIPFGGPQNFVQAYEDLNYTRGKHQFRFGGSYVYIRDNRAFGAYEEAVETLSTTSFGAGMDRFFLGRLRAFQVAVDPQGKLPCDNFRDPATVTPNCSITLPASAPAFSRSNRYHEFAAYVQDSWRVLPRFTVNLGLRWEYFGVQHNKNPSKDSNYYDALAGDIFHSIRQGNISVAPLSAVGGLWGKNWNNFGPRVGFAWDVFGNGKTSLRGGYGIAYERNFGNVTFNVIQNPPGYLVVSLIAPTDIPAASLPITTNNFGPLGGSSGTQGLPKASMRNVNPHIRTAYAHLWSLSFEREVVKNLFVALDYSGSKGVKLYTLENPNRIGSGNVYLGDPISSGLTRLRNTQVTNINRRGGNGLSVYNGINLRVDVRNIGNSGLTLRGNYTYSHAFDNLSSTFSESANNGNLGLLDPFNPGLDRGSADFDIRHNVSISGTWEIPFARHASGIAKAVFDGWTIAPIFTAHTGSPFTEFDCTNAFTVCPRAMVIGAQPARSGASNVPVAGSPNTFNYIDLSKINFDFTYVHPIVGISDFGPFPTNMLPRNFFRGPGAWNVNVGIYKTTKITERFSIQLRAEMFDVFNHSNLWVTLSDNDISSIGFVSAKRGVRPVEADERRHIQMALKLIF